MDREKHKNWLRAVYGLKCLKIFVDDFVDWEAEIFHRQLKESIKLDRHVCANNCNYNGWKPRPKQIPPFNCDVCVAWRDQIWANHTCQGGRVYWRNSNPPLWPRNKWEVAKVYMPDGHKQHYKLCDFEIVALLVFITQCKYFEKFGLKTVCEMIVNVRNEVMHSPTFELEQQTLHEYLDRIKALGEKLKENVPEFGRLSKDIEGIQNMDFTLVFPQSYEDSQNCSTSHLLNTLRQNKTEEETESLFFTAVQRAAVGQSVMDLLRLSRIDEQLTLFEFSSLRFLCRDVLSKSCLEKVRNGKELFLKLEERGLLENKFFVSQLLHAICRPDLADLLETDSRQSEENLEAPRDAALVLSDYRVMLYQTHVDLQENLDKMKFLLTNKQRKTQMEASKAALDVFAEMEETAVLSNTDVDELHAVLKQCDRQLASIVQHYRDGGSFLVHQPRLVPQLNMDNQVNSRPQLQVPLSVRETQPHLDGGQSLYTDVEPNTEFFLPHDQAYYYTLTHNPRGVCLIINNENFSGSEFRDRKGTQEDEKALRAVFTHLGFDVVTHNNLTADSMRHVLAELGKRNFMEDDALVVCVLTHGEIGCVVGTDEKKVLLRELTQPFTSGRAPTLAGKPKLFFIQACQGSNYQKGAMPCPSMPTQEEGDRWSRRQDKTYPPTSSCQWQMEKKNAGHFQVETVPYDADFLVGMATVPEHKTFRNTSTGTIYIQELCRQLQRSAASPVEEDILTVLTRVNREVSRGVFLNYKQMPEPRYTLTKKLVLKFI